MLNSKAVNSYATNEYLITTISDIMHKYYTSVL